MFCFCHAIWLGKLRAGRASVLVSFHVITAIRMSNHQSNHSVMKMFRRGGMCVWARIWYHFPAVHRHQQEKRMSTCLPFHDTMKNYVNFVMIFEFPGVDELLESFFASNASRGRSGNVEWNLSFFIPMLCVHLLMRVDSPPRAKSFEAKHEAAETFH